VIAQYKDDVEYVDIDQYLKQSIALDVEVPIV
jgi:hypothetical protein